MRILSTSRLILGLHTDGRKGVRDETGGGEQHDITEATLIELKLGEGG